MKKLLCIVAVAIISSSTYAQLSGQFNYKNSKPIEFVDGRVSEYAKIVNLLDWRGVVVSIPEDISDKAISWDVVIDHVDVSTKTIIPYLRATSFPAFFTDPTPFYDIQLDYQLIIWVGDSLIIEAGTFNL